MSDYEKMTHEDDVRILQDIVKEEGSSILQVPEVYSILKEHFNNDILDRWDREQTKKNKDIEKVPATIVFNIAVDCPTCHEFLELFDHRTFPNLNDDGKLNQVFSNWFLNKPGADDPNIKIKCPKCKIDFIVNKLEC